MGLSPPGLSGASNCSKSDWRLSLTGGFLGGEYTLFEEYPPGFPNQLGTFHVSPNADGITVVDVISVSQSPSPVFLATQSYRGVMSGYSLPLKARDATKLPQPEFPFTPLWECGLATRVAGHQPGDRVTLSSFLPIIGTRYVIPSAFGTGDYMPAGSQPFKAGEMVETFYSTCEGPPQVSPVSAPQTVATYPSQLLPQPVVVSASFVPGVARFSVSGLVNGATLALKLSRAAGGGDSWDERCAGPTCTAYLPPSLGKLEEGDTVVLSQQLCPMGVTPLETRAEVQACEKSSMPEVSPTPKAGDVSVTLVGHPLGAVVRVYATKDANPQSALELIGYAFDTNVVNLTRAIEKDDLWIIVAAHTGTCDPGSGVGLFVGEKR